MPITIMRATNIMSKYHSVKSIPRTSFMELSATPEKDDSGINIEPMTQSTKVEISSAGKQRYKRFSSMEEFRRNHPRPPHFDLMNKWNLDPELANKCEIYELRKIDKISMRDGLDYCRGTLKFNYYYFNPIYQNCTRNQINNQMHEFYIVSFRKYQDLAIAIIQPEIKK